jgi:uncharacterized membrane protein YgcG
MKILRRWCFSSFALFGLLATTSQADERILDFHSEIRVNPDASMQVDETIHVRAEGDRIHHGIYRDFPTYYRDRGGNVVRVEFTPLSAQRDGNDEQWRREEISNGVRIYLGDANVIVTPGEHDYVISYKTSRQLGFFADHDELYWNATGNGWDFPIDHASAAVSLPGPVDQTAMHLDVYTGAQGSKGNAASAQADAPSHAIFATTRGLGQREGLTIVVGFPKGVVVEPDSAQRASWFLRDNGGVLVGGIGLAVVWLYYLIQWFRVGRDPKPGVIIPQYDSPPDMTPGGLRHVERMKYDNRCFAADLVDMAVRGELSIHQNDGVFRVSQQDGSHAALPAVEAELSRKVFNDNGVLEFRQEDHVTIAAAIAQHRKSLEAQDVGRYFNTHSKVLIPGIVCGIIALVLGFFARGSGSDLAASGFMTLWLSMWTIGVVTLVANAIRAWHSPPSVAGYVGALFVTFFALPFVAAEIFGIGLFAKLAGIGFTAVLVVMILTNALFFRLMKAPTLEGRKLLDHIAGLRLYLGVAERDELAMQKSPPMTTDEYQKFLPYALALDVEKTWSDRFAAAVGPAAAAAAASSMAWYQSSSGNSFSDFSSSLGSSLSSSISSSSTAPGSSSGGGGGGSSGGGGGGGGGGGW